MSDREPWPGYSADLGMQAKAARHPEPSGDPWIHRSVSMKCHTCMWFLEKRPDNPPTTLRRASDVLGRCRRHEATVGWPVVTGGDWCGDHRLDENKA